MILIMTNYSCLRVRCYNWYQRNYEYNTSRTAIHIRLVWEIRGNLPLILMKNPCSPIKNLFNLMFGMCRSHHAVEVKLHEERKARKELRGSLPLIIMRNPPLT
jgi:hypothetical protein